MKVCVEITRDPLRPRGVCTSEREIGAVVEFAGVVRQDEEGVPIAALDYEAYEGMARSEMERIARELATSYPCRSLEVTHRIGPVAVGEASILVRIESMHRAEAFAMLQEFMEHLKRDVPIWKKVAP